MKVWLTYAGEYEDRHVTGVYTDEQLARKVCNAFNWHISGGAYEVNQHNIPQVQEGLRFFHVTLTFDLQGKHTNSHVEQDHWYTPCSESSSWEEDFDYAMSAEDATRIDFDKPIVHGHLFHTTCWARDEEQAVQIACERASSVPKPSSKKY